MIRSLHSDFALGSNRPQCRQEFRDVLDFRGELFQRGRRHLVPRRQFGRHMAIVFQHRATTGDIDNHRINAIEIKRGGIRLRKFQRRCTCSAVIMNRPAAGLITGNHHVAAIRLQHPGRCPVHVMKHRIGHTTGEQGDTCPTWTNRRQKFGKLRLTRF